MKKIFLIFCMFAVIGCGKGKEEIVIDEYDIFIKSKSSVKVFEYSSANFKPQVHTEEDFVVLKKIMEEAIEEAKKRDDLPLAANLMASFKMGDMRRVEYLLYSYKRNKLLNSKKID